MLCVHMYGIVGGWYAKDKWRQHFVNKNHVNLTLDPLLLAIIVKHGIVLYFSL